MTGNFLRSVAFDESGNLYVAASIGGRKGIVRVTPERAADLFLSGPGIVGLASGMLSALAYLQVTTLGLLRKGGRVNIEVDIIGKYVEKLLSAGRTASRTSDEEGINHGFLAEHGFN